METKNKNKLSIFFKNYGTILVSSVLIIAIAITLLIVGLSPTPMELSDGDKNDSNAPVTSTVTTYSLPMKNASIIKDFSNTELQYNQTLNCWEAHLSVDMISLDADVMAVSSGKVIAVENDFLMGNIVKIEHENGLVSVYASLDENVLVKVGDSVSGGQVIATAGNTASSESSDGVHLDFTMLLNGEEVDPNDYLALQNK